MSDLLIRDSRDDDVPAIQAVYAHHVLHGTGTFELDPPTVPDMHARRADVLKNGFPYLVAEGGGRVLGYAYANWFRMRPAYRFTVEDSIYVAEDARGRGVGRTLLDALAGRCERIGCRQLLAIIGDSANTGSIALHARCGFRSAGTMRATGWKHGRWLDTVIMQRELGASDREPPAG
jgi:phosphinothricin acetyltransferase